MSNIDFEFIDNVLKVLRKLLASPDKRSKEISNDLHLPKKELIDIYHFIGKKKDLRDLLHYHSVYPQSTIPIFDYIQDQKKIEDILESRAVVPTIVELHLGEVCNLNCQMCYSRDIEYQEKIIGKKPLDKNTIIVMLSEMKEMGVKEIWFSGGKEPLTAPTTLDAIKYANKIGLVTRLYTNGELLDSFEKRKKVLGCYQVRFSLNASKASTYNKIHLTGNKKIRVAHKVFSKVVKNFKALVKLKKQNHSKVKIAISFILQPLNYKELTSIVKMAWTLGADSTQIRVESVETVRKFSKGEKKAILSQVSTIRAKQKQGDFGQMEIDFRGISEGELNADKNEYQFLLGLRKAKICRAGSLKRGINPYGEIFECEFSMHPGNVINKVYSSRYLGKICENNFMTISQRTKVKYPKVCRKCQAFEYGLNIILEKLKDDYDWGINLADQPYYER